MRSQFGLFLFVLTALTAGALNDATAAGVEVKPFGKTKDGKTVHEYTLTNSKGMVVSILSRGATLRSIMVPDAKGNSADVILGFDDVAGYESDANQYFGCTVGRVCNRIGGAKFTVDDIAYKLLANDGKNTLHGGGDKSFDKRVWAGEVVEGSDARGVKFTLFSSDGEEGFPGNVHASIRYLLTDNNSIRMDYEASTDISCPMNLTNHAYFNLSGAGAATILNHELQLNCRAYTPTDDQLIPTGSIDGVDGTPLDFRKATVIGARIEKLTDTAALGYDHNYVIDRESASEPEVAAILKDPTSGRILEVLTDQAGIQFYSGNFLKGQTGKGGKTYAHRSGLCLEAQSYPDSINQPDFPSIVLDPGETYRQTTIYRFKTQE